MKVLLIKQCPDVMRWYSGLVGQTVPYLGDVGDEYKSREPEGYVNFVQYDDADVVEDDSFCGGYERVGWRHEKNRQSPWATCPGCLDCRGTNDESGSGQSKLTITDKYINELLKVQILVQP